MQKIRMYNKIEVTAFLLQILSDAKEAGYYDMNPFDKAQFFSDWLDENNLREDFKMNIPMDLPQTSRRRN